MNLDDTIDAWLGGARPPADAAHREELAMAQLAMDAIRLALEETVFEGGRTGGRPPPQLPDDYHMVEEIGRGGMGVVYRAHQRSLDRDVAIKVLRPGEAKGGPLLARFLEEARHLARLRHPNIVSVHEVGEADGEPYFTMDYVRGEPLSARLRRGPLPPTQAIGIVEQTGQAVQFAHEHGIIHRDLKPANILLDETGRAFVTDFGLARDTNQAASVTRSGEILGTPAYMAREQALGQTELIGESTDIYGLGAVLYEMLSGQTPYGNDAPAKVLARLIQQEAPPLRKWNRRITRDLETVVQCALASLPQRRYPTVRAFLEDLRRARDGMPVLARRPGVVRRGAAWLRRRAGAATAVVATTAVVAAAAWLWRPAGEPSLPQRAAAYAAAGAHEQAVRTWTDAFAAAGPAVRPQLVAHMVASCRAIGDRERAIRACELVLECDRDAGFGALDFDVAEALATRVRSAVEVGETVTTELRDLAHHRLERLLAQPDLDSGQHTAAVLSLRFLEAGDFGRPTTGERPSQLDEWARPPQFTADTTPEQLLAAARAADASRWDRARAAHAAAWALEGEGRTPAAAAAYLEAFELLRPYYPVYAASADPTAAGLKRFLGPLGGFQDTGDDRRRWLMVRIAAGRRRLAPDAPDRLRARLLFSTTGTPIPPSLKIRCAVKLADMELSAAAAAELPSIGFGLQPDGSGWLGVADGSYRLELGNTTRFPLDETARRFQHFMAIDAKALPAAVQVQGANVVLPPVRIWLRAEVELSTPAAGAQVDLDRDVFAWSAVPGAAYYEVVFDRHLEGIRLGSLVERARVEATTLRVADRPALRRRLPQAQLDQWTVEAFDEGGDLIGITRKADLDRRFQLPR